MLYSQDRAESNRGELWHESSAVAFSRSLVERCHCPQQRGWSRRALRLLPTWVIVGFYDSMTFKIVELFLAAFRALHPTGCRWAKFIYMMMACKFWAKWSSKSRVEVFYLHTEILLAKTLQREFTFLSHCKKQLMTHGEFGEMSYFHSNLSAWSLLHRMTDFVLQALSAPVLFPTSSHSPLWHQASLHTQRVLLCAHIRYLAILSVQDMVMSCSPSSTPSHVCAALWHRTGMVPSPDSILVRRCPRYFLTMCLLLFTGQNKQKEGQLLDIFRNERQPKFAFTEPPVEVL